MADAKVGGVYADFTARYGQMLAGVRTVGRGLRQNQEMVRNLRRTYVRFNREAREMVSQFFSLRGAVGALAGAGGLLYLVRSTVKATSEIGELAEQAGASNRTFQELTYVARQYAVSQDALVDGLKEMNLRIEEFVVTGKGSAEEALQRLGFSTSDLAAGLMDTGALFEEIVRRLQDFDAAARIRIADELFGGTGGEQLVRIINGGTRALQDMTAEAHRAGQVFEDSLIGQSRTLAREFDNLTADLQTRLQRAILDNAEAIQNLVGIIVENVPRVVAFSEGLASGFRFIVDNARSILLVLGTAKGALSGAAAGGLLGPKGRAVGAALGGVGAVIGVRELLKLLDDGSRSIEEMEARAAELRDSLADVGDRLAVATRRAQAGVGSETLVSVLQDHAARARAELEELEKSIARVRRAAATPAEGSGPAAATPGPPTRGGGPRSDLYVMEPILRQLQMVPGEMELARRSAADLGAQIQINGELLEEWPRSTGRLSRELMALNRTSDMLGRTLGDFVGDLGQNIHNLGDAIGSLAREISAILRTELISRPLAEAIGDRLRGSVSLFSLLAGVRGARHGGVHGGWTLVGEEGPELVRFPASSARVFPADESRRMLGAAGEQIVIAPEFGAGVSMDQVRAYAHGELLPAMVRLVEQGLAERRRRG